MIVWIPRIWGRSLERMQGLTLTAPKAFPFGEGAPVRGRERLCPSGHCRPLKGMPLFRQKSVPKSRFLPPSPEGKALCGCAALFRHGFAVPPSPKGKAFCGCAALFRHGFAVPPSPEGKAFCGFAALFRRFAPPSPKGNVINLSANRKDHHSGCHLEQAAARRGILAFRLHLQ